MEVSFSQKVFLNKYTVILVSFSSGGFFDEVFCIWKDYRGYKDDVRS